MLPVITAFAQSPDRGRGQARDMRVRWALEEVGQAYEVRLVTFAELKEPGHRARQPFGQIPSYEEQGLTLFESGAIVLHIAETKGQGLLPAAPAPRARAKMWLMAALSTIEPPILERESIMFFEQGDPDRLARVDARIGTRLSDLDAALGTRDWLEGEFTVGDLMMVSVLRRIGGTTLLGTSPRLHAYVARGEARPAFQRAFAAQRAVFEALSAGSTPSG